MALCACSGKGSEVTVPVQERKVCSLKTVRVRLGFFVISMHPAKRNGLGRSLRRPGFVLPWACCGFLRGTPILLAREPILSHI